VLQLRDYQREALDAVLAAARRGVRRQLVVLPTGAGKTVVAAALARQATGRVLFLCHRDELVQQAVEKFGFLWPADAIGVVKAARDETDRRIVVASVQTLQQPHRLARLDPAGFSLAIIDEAHHAPSRTYRAILAALGFWPAPPPGKLLVGITATPQRADGVGLGHVFDTVAYRRSIHDLVRAGYLADVRGVRVATQVDLAHVRRRHGDFELQDLSLAVDTPARNALVVDAYRRYGENRKAVVFTVDVAHAQHMAEAFRAAGYAADWVAGALPAAARQARLAAFRAGAIQVLANAQVLLEGYDDPSIEAVIMARPTRSQAWFIQAVGRGLRPYPGKVDCLVLDVADTGHDLVTLDQLAAAGALPDAARRTAPGETPATDESAAEPVAPLRLVGAVPLDLLARSQFVWRREGRRLVLEAGPGREIWCDALPDGGDRWTVTLRGRGTETPLTDQPLTLAYAQGVAEDWVRAHKLEGYAARDAAWRQRPPTPKQVALLHQLGVAVPDGATRADATALIRDTLRRRALEDPAAPWRQEPASARQVAWMRARGLTVPPGFTKGDFADLLARLKRRAR